MFLRNYFFNSVLMDVVFDESGEDEDDNYSEQSWDPSEDALDTQEDDPDYDPNGTPMDDTEEIIGTEPQPTPESDHPEPSPENDHPEPTPENDHPEPTPENDHPQPTPENDLGHSPSSRENDHPQRTFADYLDHLRQLHSHENEEPSAAASANCAIGVAEVEVKSDDANDRLLAATQKGSDDDGQYCTICFEPWSNSSEHRLVSLRCGHLFGRSCISRWLAGQNMRCPQCNSRARKSEIRNIYAKAVKVIDSSERDKALHDLTIESELRRAAEMNAAQERMKHMMVLQECERLKKELMEAQRQLHEYRLLGFRAARMQSGASSLPAFSLLHSIEISKNGGCKILDSSSMLGMLLVSQPSSNILFTGFGFRKISTHDMKASEFVLVHQKPIKDMAFHVNDALVLTASLDKTLKITNILSNTVAQTYTVPSDAWSCAWNIDNPSYFYGGLRTGEVFVYDIRVTSRYVYELPSYGMKTPVVSLQYFHQPLSANHRNSGPLVGKLSGGCFFYSRNVMTPTEYQIIPLPTPGPVICLSSISSGPCLVSCRPSKDSRNVTHTLCDFVDAPSGELVCSPVKTLLGGKSQLHLTRTKVLNHPDKASSSLVCAGDEDAHGIIVWDGSSGDHVADLKISDGSVLDLCGLNMNHKSFLTALVDKNLLVYGWNGV